MIRQAYMKPEVRALTMQQSGLVCTSLNNISSDEFDYGGAGGSQQPQAPPINSCLWEEEEDNKTNSDP